MTALTTAVEGQVVLVLGATGSVGARLAASLRRDGALVRGLHRHPEQSALLAARGLAPHPGQLSDPDSLARAADGCDVVYHCAGEASHRADARALAWLHVAGTENVVNAARAVGVKRLVVLSCADVRLQNRERIHIREEQGLLGAPLGPWAKTKLLAEEMALQASRSRFLVSAVRPAFLWGAGDLTNLPGLCAEGLSGGIRLFGGGRSLFSVASIDNVVHGMRLAAACPDAGGQSFHISDGEYETAAEFFASISASLSWPEPRTSFGSAARALAFLRERTGAPGPGLADVVRRGRGCLLDIERAINVLGYSPVRTRAEALSDLVEFVAAQGGDAALAQRSRRPPLAV